MADNKDVNDKSVGVGGKVFFDDKPYAHMYMKDQNGFLVRMVESQPLEYLQVLIENTEQSTRTVSMLNTMSETQLDQAQAAMESDDEDALDKVKTAIATIFGLKGDVSTLVKNAPSDIDTLKTLMTRLLQDAQAEDAMVLTGGREMCLRENAADVSKSKEVEIIRMPNQ